MIFTLGYTLEKVNKSVIHMKTNVFPLQSFMLRRHGKNLQKVNEWLIQLRESS